MSELIQAGVATLRNPREGARWVMQLSADRRTRWEILLLIAVLSAIFAFVSVYLNAGLGNVDLEGQPVMSPFLMAVAQALVLTMMVFAVHFVGRALGGKGDLDDAIVLVAWIQAILIGFQVLQIISALILPPIALLIGVAGFAVMFWLLTVFVSELHGFRSTGRIFFSVLVVMVILATLLRTLFGLFGINATGVI